MFSFLMPFSDHQGCCEHIKNQKNGPPGWMRQQLTCVGMHSTVSVENGLDVSSLHLPIQVPFPRGQSAETYDHILLTISILGLYFAFQLKCLGLSNHRMEELGQKCRARIKGSELEYEKV